MGKSTASGWGRDTVQQRVADERKAGLDIHTPFHRPIAMPIMAAYRAYDTYATVETKQTKQL